MLYFPPFRFDERTRVLSKAGREVPLTHKAADLLACLLEQPGILATHQEIMQRVWPDTHVQSENIKALVHELRGALGDQSHTSTFIRSEPGRGYVFVPGVAHALPPFLSEAEPMRETPLVGRDAELALLEHHMAAATERSEPHLVLIEGERGVGKTSLCEALAQRAYRRFGARITCGQGLEVWGPVEEGAVLIDALDVLARQYPVAVRTALAARAPKWLQRIAPIPSEAVNLGERPLRELVAAFDDLAGDVPLLLILEDLQWADAATIESLRAIGRRRASRLAIIATYTRMEDLPSVEAIERVGRELSSSEWCITIELRPLTEDQLRGCLELRFGVDVARTLAGPLVRAGGGNPALSVVTVNSLIRLGALRPTPEGWIVDATADRLDSFLATSLLNGFQCQIDRLSSGDRRVLRAAASADVEFTAGEIAQSLGPELAPAIARRLNALAERQVLVEAVEHVDRRVAAAESAFRFRHGRIGDLLIDRDRDRTREFRATRHASPPLSPNHIERRANGRRSPRPRH